MGVVLIENNERVDVVAFAHSQPTIVDVRLNTGIFVELFDPRVSDQKVADFRLNKAD